MRKYLLFLWFVSLATAMDHSEALKLSSEELAKKLDQETKNFIEIDDLIKPLLDNSENGESVLQVLMEAKGFGKRDTFTTEYVNHGTHNKGIYIIKKLGKPFLVAKLVKYGQAVQDIENLYRVRTDLVRRIDHRNPRSANVPWAFTPKISIDEGYYHSSVLGYFFLFHPGKGVLYDSMEFFAYEQENKNELINHYYLQSGVLTGLSLDDKDGDCLNWTIYGYTEDLAENIFYDPKSTKITFIDCGAFRKEKVFALLGYLMPLDPRRALLFFQGLHMAFGKEDIKGEKLKQIFSVMLTAIKESFKDYSDRNLNDWDNPYLMLYRIIDGNLKASNVPLQFNIKFKEYFPHNTFSQELVKMENITPEIQQKLINLFLLIRPVA